MRRYRLEIEVALVAARTIEVEASPLDAVSKSVADMNTMLGRLPASVHIVNVELRRLQAEEE